MSRNALIAGVTGIVGNNLAHQLLSNGWEVHGLARRSSNDIEGVNFIAADLLDAAALRSAVAELKPTHVFITTWLRQPTETENIRVNSAMVRNLLKAVAPAKSVRHAALVTGLKHYLGPFEAYGKASSPPHPFAKSSPVSTSTTSTTPRKTSSSPPPRITNSAGRSIARIPSSAMPSATR
ncbi:NAD-dependent epimerase/dehydratase family protein [Tunturiibacter gelidiferens]